MKFFLQPRVASFIIALAFALMASLQLWLGAESTPAPIHTVLQGVFAMPDLIAARLIIAAEFGIAAAVLCAGVRPLNVAATTVSAFVALACVSRALREGGLPLSALALISSLALLALAVHAAPRLRAVTARRGMSSAWTALGALAAATIGMRVAASTSFRAPITDEAASGKVSVSVIDLDMKPFIGRHYNDTSLASYLPDLGPLVSEGTAFVVFYHPNCQTCHGLFDDYFAVPRVETVVAVEIPPATGSISASHEELGPIHCPQCSMLMLPPGPAWGVASPMVVKFENGIITCSSDRYGGDCLNPAQ